MIELPEGNSLGWMQAPSSWISSHTVRFIGVVRVVIQDGEGFILIKKGKPLFHYFKHGSIELKGHSARDYFNSHPIIEFNLCKYSPEEFALALKVCNIEENEPPVPKEPESPAPVPGKTNPPPPPADAPVATPVRDMRTPDPVISPPEIPTVEVRPVVPHPTDAPVATPVHEIKVPDPVISSPEIPTVEESPVVPQPVAGDELDLTIISQIRDLNGIVAISVFNDKRNIIMMGDADSETLLKIAGTMLETAQNVTPLLTWGPFVHLTLQIPEGNIIIAPYHDNYLCLLTTRTINIGHIRRILRDLQQKQTSQQGS
jgi:predicted regulator of Ras-like GTPase activity (Roadblock/LC7/MglB family)